PPKRMSSEEKQQIVQQLNDQGVLMLKGAVAEIAEQLYISEGTVYRYINKKTT
ncbi:MAG: YheO-like PAS domain protein, partial [Clostridia bacterium]|nr:YheO-like PAS domain protein [Clostridia bacterium]